MKYLFTSILLILGLSSCYEKYVQVPFTVDSVDELQFLEIGRSLTYKVDSYFYQELYADSQRHSEYYIRESITDTFRDAEGNLCYYVIQARKTDLADSFRNIKAFSYILQDQYLIRQEDNAKIVILSFPLLKKIRWNPMMFTYSDFLNIDQLLPTQINWTSTVTSMDTTYTNPFIVDQGNKLDSCIGVSVADIYNGGSADYTDAIKFHDIYRKEIGPVYREREAYVKRTSIVNKRGFKLVFECIDYD